MGTADIPPVYPIFTTPADIVRTCAELGVSSVQTDVAGWDRNHHQVAHEVAAAIQSTGLEVEGLVELPVSEGDLHRFHRELTAGKLAGASIFRIMCMLQRRYEKFHSPEEFEQYREDSLRRLRLARPSLHDLDVRLAIENHKDWLAEDLVRILEELDDPHYGVTLDTGNNIAMMEDPYAVVEELAPWTMSCHLKDMAVSPSVDGFLMSEVPLGQGFLDLPRMASTCLRANPDITFQLEMPTRDPLSIPCLTDDYWSTFPNRDREKLTAQMLDFVRANASPTPLPRVSHLPMEELLRLEHQNVETCLSGWREISGG